MTEALISLALLFLQFLVLPRIAIIPAVLLTLAALKGMKDKIEHKRNQENAKKRIRTATRLLRMGHAANAVSLLSPIVLGAFERYPGLASLSHGRKAEPHERSGWPRVMELCVDPSSASLEDARRVLLATIKLMGTPD